MDSRIVRSVGVCSLIVLIALMVPRASGSVSIGDMCRVVTSKLIFPIGSGPLFLFSGNMAEWFDQAIRGNSTSLYVGRELVCDADSRRIGVPFCGNGTMCGTYFSTVKEEVTEAIAEGNILRIGSHMCRSQMWISTFLILFSMCFLTVEMWTIVLEMVMEQFRRFLKPYDLYIVPMIRFSANIFGFAAGLIICSYFYEVWDFLLALTCYLTDYLHNVQYMCPE